MDRLHVDQNDLDGIVENGRDIDGVEVSVFLYETEKGLKASLLSNDYVNVSDVCIMFGGGGHIRAAGAFCLGTAEQIKEKVVAEIKKQLK